MGNVGVSFQTTEIELHGKMHTPQRLTRRYPLHTTAMFNHKVDPYDGSE